MGCRKDVGIQPSKLTGEESTIAGVEAHGELQGERMGILTEEAVLPPFLLVWPAASSSEGGPALRKKPVCDRGLKFPEVEQ